MRRLLPLLLSALLGACASTPEVRPRDPATVESRVVETSDLASIQSALQESGVRSTLLVLDIDDTLLTSSGFFGSDAWYEWQKRLPDGDPGKVPCLFDVIALNYEAGTQQPTQDNGPALVNPLPVDTLLLSSRNPLYRGGTLRTLRDAGYALPAMLGDQREGRSWEFRGTSDARPVTVAYADGVFLTSGQDKGKVLLDLLHRLDLRYDRVVLVDDGRRNIDNMQAALKAAGIDYLGLHYTRVDKTVDADDEQAGRDGWASWRQLMSSLYPERLQALEAGKCAY